MEEIENAITDVGSVKLEVDWGKTLNSGTLNRRSMHILHSINQSNSS